MYLKYVLLIETLVRLKSYSIYYKYMTDVGNTNRSRNSVPFTHLGWKELLLQYTEIHLRVLRDFVCRIVYYKEYLYIKVSMVNN